MLITAIARWRDSAARSFQLGSSRARRADRSRGQVIVIFALFLLVLFGAAALTVDYGTWLKARRDYQNVADPAALAGSVFLTRPTTSTERTLARRAAWEEVNRQLGLGMSNGDMTSRSNGNTVPGGDTIGTYKIWVNSPPVTANDATTTSYPGAQVSPTSRSVFVRVERPNPAFLSRSMGLGDRVVNAWATAGVFPNRFAIITLREQGMAPGSVNDNISLNGSGTTLEAVNGDVGGNWNMKLNAGSELWVRGQSDNDAEAYLMNYISCGSSCWSAGQINSGPSGAPANAPKTPLQLPGVIPDPNYPLPPALTPPTTGAKPLAVPNGDDGDGAGGDSAGEIDVRSGGPNVAPGSTSNVGGVLTCSADSPRIGPGYYTEISVANGKCLILDPIMRHTSIMASTPDVPTPVPATQLPGIFYIDGDIDVATNAMIVGDGVTLILRPDSEMLVSGGGVIDLNRGQTPGGSAMKLGAWTTLGASTFTFNAGTGTWGYASSMDGNTRNVGMALYIVKRSQYSSVAVDDNTDIIKINAGAGLAWRGVTYAPHDNVTLSGQPGHDGVGQLVSWTFKFAGGVHVTQEYEGPEDGVPFLLEPRTGQ